MNKLLLAAGLLLTVGASYAQTPGTPGSGSGPGGPVPTAVPLDGGSSLLLASGVAYGLRRLQQRRAQRQLQ